MKQRRWWILAVAVAVAAFGLGGCGGGGDSGPAVDGAGESRGLIGLSVLTLTNPFFKEIADAVVDEAGKAGYRVLVTSGEFKIETQQAQVKDFIVRKADAIILCPCDSKAIGPVIGEANEAGIPVFTADIGCLAPGVDVVAHIATDNLGGGREAGRAMIEALEGGGGKVVILDYKSAESCLLRVQGFKEVIADHNANAPDRGIEIVAELPGEGMRDRGFKAAEDAIQAHPDLAGIFAINDPSALGARAALEKAGKADQVKIVAFDGQPEGKQAIRDGKIYADPIQFPEEIGRQTVRTILRHFNGEAVDPEVLIPTRLYRMKDALQDPDLK